VVAAFDRAIVTFESPPVVEVVAGVGFEESDAAMGASLAAFWQAELRHEYPRLDNQAPYIPTREQFEDGSIPRPPQLQIELAPTTPFPRMWASTADQSELVQLHPRFFACNWRRVQKDAKYDNWRSRRDKFVDVFERLAGYLDSVSMAMPKVSQCEVTYVNHIRAGNSWHSHSEWWRIFDVQFGSSSPYPVERLTAEAQFVIDRAGGSKARLHCKVFPAFDSELELPIYVLELTARGAPDGNGLAEVLAFMDEARQAIDETFLSVTTRAIQEEWGIHQ